MEIFSTVLSDSALDITFLSFIKILGGSLITGLIIAYLYNLKTKSSKSFLTTLAILPAIVSMVIIMVNGNIGTGVAVAGAFSLVRFRSVPGTAREIGALFLAMASGITLGMGYIGFAIMFTIIICLFYLLLDYSNFGQTDDNKRNLTIVIPEDLNYAKAFEDVFEKYTTKSEIVFVKSTNMGSMFKIKYNILLIDPEKEKEFIDELRVRNSNLDILVTRSEMMQNEL